MSFPNTSCKEKTAHKEVVSIRQSRRGQTDAFILTETKVRDQTRSWRSFSHSAFRPRAPTRRAAASGWQTGCVLSEHSRGLKRGDIHQLPVWVAVSPGLPSPATAPRYSGAGSVLGAVKLPGTCSAAAPCAERPAPSQRCGACC